MELWAKSEAVAESQEEVEESQEEVEESHEEVEEGHLRNREGAEVQDHRVAAAVAGYRAPVTCHSGRG